MTERAYKDPEFGIVILRKNARSRAISIRVRGSGNRYGSRISVTIPWSVSYQDGISYMEKRRDWIREALKRQDLKADDAELGGTAVGEIVDGTCVKTLVSKILFVEGDSEAEEGRVVAKLKCENVDPPQGAVLWLSLDNPIVLKTVTFPRGASQVGLRKILVDVLREEAKILLGQKLDYLAKDYGFVFKRLTVKHNSSNWGSCSRAGNINLNLNLIRLPEPLCDYVILHELAHLKEPNHGVRFHELLEYMCLQHIKQLIDWGSQDALKYEKWLTDKSLPPLDEVLSREISAWRLV